MEAASRRKPSAIIRMRMAQVCQPEAMSEPAKLRFAASSSTCIGCGSYSRAKAMISSRVTVGPAWSATEPGRKSSK
jgi:hypothetical protein